MLCLYSDVGIYLSGLAPNLAKGGEKISAKILRKTSGAVGRGLPIAKPVRPACVALESVKRIECAGG